MIDDTRRRVLDLFAEGRSLYKERRFADALTKFESATAIDPDDGPTLEYIGRCRQFIANPPPDNWDGVYEMTSK